MVVVAFTPPPVAMVVIGLVPGLVLMPTEMTILEVPLPGAGMTPGEKLMVEPDGRPEADKYTLSSKPQQIVVVDVPVA